MKDACWRAESSTSNYLDDSPDKENDQVDTTYHILFPHTSNTSYKMYFSFRWKSHEL